MRGLLPWAELSVHGHSLPAPDKQIDLIALLEPLGQIGLFIGLVDKSHANLDGCVFIHPVRDRLANVGHRLGDIQA